MHAKPTVVDDVVSFIEEETWIPRDGRRGRYEVRDNGVDVWLPVDGARLFWALFSHVERHEHASITAFKVEPDSVRGTDYPMYVHIGPESGPSICEPPRPLQEYVETARAYHKFSADNFTPETSKNQCGDINKTIREGLRFEYDVKFTLAAGALFNPMTNKGQGHMFIVIPSRYISDRDYTVFLDGAALQFADGYHDFPQTLGPAATIDRVHVVGPMHEHRPYYARNDDAIDTEYAYEESG